MTEDSMHRTLNAALARNSGPSAEDVADPTPTVADANALTGDDIESWLTNPFMSPDMIAEKVCWWVTVAEARGAERGARAVVEAVVSPETLEEMRWRLANYGPIDAKPFEFSRFASPAHAAFSVAEEVARLAAEAAARIEGGA